MKIESGWLRLPALLILRNQLFFQTANYDRIYAMSAAAILKLQASGFTSEQVSALAELIDTQVATKADVEAAEHRLELKI